MNHSYAIIRLSDLKLTKLTSRDELYDAIASLRGRDIQYAAFKWSADASAWVQLDVSEFKTFR